MPAVWRCFRCAYNCQKDARDGAFPYNLGLCGRENKPRERIMPTETTDIQDLANREYKWGFITDIEADSAPMGLNEEIIRFISAKKNEPKWLLDWRLKAYRHWLTME